MLEFPKKNWRRKNNACVVYLFDSNIWYQDRVHFEASFGHQLHVRVACTSCGGTNLVFFGPHWVVLGHIWPVVGLIWPHIRLCWDIFCHMWPNIMLCWNKFGHFRLLLSRAVVGWEGFWLCAQQREWNEGQIIGFKFCSFDHVHDCAVHVHKDGKWVCIGGIYMAYYSLHAFPCFDDEFCKFISFSCQRQRFTVRWV